MCRHTARSHAEATNSYEDGLFELLVVAPIIPSPPLHPPSHHTEILGGADVLPAFYSFSSLQLLSSKFPGLGRPVPRLCLQVFLLELIHKQALRPGQGPAPGKSGLFLIKPVCKYHLQSYSQQKSPVYCILASGFLRSLDLGHQAAMSRRRVPPRLKISVITGVPTPPVSSSGADAET